MSRERDRIAKRREKNPIVECNRVQRKFYPELFSKFEQITDPRHGSYIDYSSKVMLGTMYYKSIISHGLLTDGFCQKNYF